MRDNKFSWLAQLIDIALLVHLVRLLVVDEEVGGALAACPLVKQSLVGLRVEGLLHEKFKLELVSYEGNRQMRPEIGAGALSRTRRRLGALGHHI